MSSAYEGYTGSIHPVENAPEIMRRDLGYPLDARCPVVSSDGSSQCQRTVGHEGSHFPVSPSSREWVDNVPFERPAEPHNASSDPPGGKVPGAQFRAPRGAALLPEIQKWDHRFLEQAALTATWSKDPRKQAACVIVDDKRNTLSGGYNGFPRGMRDDERLNDRDLKLKIIVHAEANAVAAAARNGHSLEGGIIYITHPPCSRCAVLLLQAGVHRVVWMEDKPSSKWAEDCQLAIELLHEAGLSIAEYPRLTW